MTPTEKKAAADAALDRATECLARNILAEIAKRFIPLEADKQTFIATGDTNVWDSRLGRYRFFVKDTSPYETDTATAATAWHEVKRVFDMKTHRGRHARMMKLAQRWKVGGL
jgi:hypothetical protein